MTKEERDALIERYASGSAEVVSSLEGFPPDQLTTRAVPGKRSAADWHTEVGLYTAERWLEIYAEHAHGHAEQIRRLRAALSGS